MDTRVEPSVRRESVSRQFRPTRVTAIQREHVAAGATMVERDGWMLPLSYGNPEGEKTTLREGVGLLDISELGKINLKGEAIDSTLAAAFRQLSARRRVVAAPSGGQPSAGPINPMNARCALAVGKTAWPLDNIRVLRLTQQEALLLTPANLTQTTLDELRTAAHSGACDHMIDLTSSLCGLRLLGPRTPEVLQRVSALDLALDRFVDGSFVQGSLAKIHALIARRDIAGLPSFDVYVDRDLGVYLWQVLVDIGAPFGISPVGRQAEEDLG